MIKVIENWVAKRSGAYLTIEGDRNGQPVKLTNITGICAGTPYPIARDVAGGIYHLDASDAPNATDLAA